jgi:hypothetical protein
MPRMKKIPLVSQHLERVSAKALEKYRRLLGDVTHRRHGIYALHKGSALYYVGLARNLKTRINQHVKDRHKRKWDRFSVYLTIGGDHIRELELLLLRIAQPKGNRQLGRFSGAEDLRRKLLREARRQANDELAEWFPRKLGQTTKKRRDKPQESDARLPVLAGIVFRRRQLRAMRHGKPVRARILNSGAIRVNKVRFNSPSMAAYEASGRRGAVNGWNFWRFERAPGDWVQLKELRK